MYWFLFSIYTNQMACFQFMFILGANLLKFLKTLAPSELEAEFRMLSPDMGGSIDSLCQFMESFVLFLKSGKDYELVQGYVSLFLKVYVYYILLEIMLYRVFHVDHC